MKRTVLIFTIVVVAALTLPAYYILKLKQTYDSHRTFLLTQIDHRAVAEGCLDILTDPKYQPLIGSYLDGTDSRLPGAVRAIKPFWLSVNTNEILIMKTGGHYHMGLIFRPTSADSHHYDLVFREESDLKRDIPLISLHKETKGEPVAAPDGHPRLRAAGRR